jgi:general secretion pathway protein F
LSIFNQQLYSLLEAGQTVVDAIDMLGKNDRRGRNRTIFDALLRELKEGNQLSDAMESLPSVFPSLYVAMVRSSETTGTVREAIERYMLYQRQVDGIRQKVIAAATYPAVLLGVGFLVISFLMLYVLPRFSEVYDDEGSVKARAACVGKPWRSRRSGPGRGFPPSGSRLGLPKAAFDAWCGRSYLGTSVSPVIPDVGHAAA